MLFVVPMLCNGEAVGDAVKENILDIPGRKCRLAQSGHCSQCGLMHLLDLLPRRSQRGPKFAESCLIHMEQFLDNFFGVSMKITDGIVQQIQRDFRFSASVICS